MTDKSQNVPEPARRAERWSATRLRAAARHQGHEDESILFIRPDSYGDLILFEPVVRWFRQHWPATRIGMLARQAIGDVAPLLPSGVEWLLLDADPLHAPLDEISGHPRIGEMVRDFDPAVLVAASHGKTWMEILAGLAVHDRRQVRLGPLNVELTIEMALRRGGVPLPPPIFSEVVEVPADLPEVEKNHRLLEKLAGESIPREDPRVQVPRPAQAAADAILATLGLAPRSFIVCCPAGIANVALKTWPARSFADALAAVVARVPAAILLLGTEAEADILQEVASNLGQHSIPAVHQHLGKPGSFAVTAGLLQRCRAFLGNDTGTLHLAAALRRPTAGIYGGGTWPRFRPAHDASIAFVNPIPCFSCGWDCHLDRPLCLHAIRPDDVADRFVDLLRRQVQSRQTVELQNVSEILFPILAGSRRRYDELQADRLARAGQVLALREAVQQCSRETEANARELSAQLKESNGALAAAQNELDLRMQQIDELTHGLRSREARLIELDADLANVNRLARIQAEQHTQHLTQTQDDHAALRLTIETQGAQLLDLDRQLTEVNRTAGELAARLETKNSEVADLHRQITEINRLATEQQQASALQVAELDRQVTEVNEIARRQAEESATVIHRLEEDVHTLSTQVRESNERAAALDADLGRLNQLARDEIAGLGEQRDAARAEVEVWSRRASEAESRITDLTAELTKAHEDGAAREKQIEDQSRRQNAMEAELGATRESARTEGDALRARIAEREREITNLRDQLTAAHGEITAQQSRIAGLAVQNATLERTRLQLLTARWTRIGIALHTLKLKLDPHP